MSCLDLTAAVEAAAERAWEKYREMYPGNALQVVLLGVPEGPLPEWEHLPERHKNWWREDVLPIVSAAAPAIARQAIPAPTHTNVQAILSGLGPKLVTYPNPNVGVVQHVLEYLRRTTMEDRP